MNKDKLFKAILNKVKSNLTLAIDAVKMAHESATHEENIAECKYDTKGLEASYLVQGQARRVEELENSMAALQSLKVRAVDKVMLNALVILKDEHNKEEHMFIAPACGGLIVDFEGKKVMIMTPASPLAQALLGKSSGDEISVKVGRKEKEYRVVSVS